MTAWPGAIAERTQVPIPENSQIDGSQKGSLLRKSSYGSGQADVGTETRRRNLFIASQVIFRYYFLIRSNQDHLSERVVYMPQRPAGPGPGRDGDPARAEEDWLAWCEAVEGQLGPDEEEPEDAAPWDVDVDALIAECREITAEEAALAARAAWRGLPGGTTVADGRRGPGQPGSAVRRPGEFGSRAAGFGAGMALDTMPGCGALAGFAAEAAGEDDRYAGACDDEVAGVISAWDRVEAYAAARKHAAVAEFIRRRPRPGCPPAGPARMPESWDESITAEVAGVLAESRPAADAMLDLAHDLEVRLPGTKAAFRDGILRQSKVAIIARACAVLDPAEARAAERLVLDRAGRLTPGALRAAIAHAVMEVAPKKARKRREAAAKFARVERWAEDSGNAALMGREMASDEVLAADQRITAWAQELKKAGLEGDMDVLRARAYLDLLLGKDSRPGQDGAAARPVAGFAGRVTLTVPLATVIGLADRPGEISGIGPVDPWLAQDLANAAAANPKTTWCVTVTDEQGHAVGHGCARPEPKSHRKRAGPAPPGGARDGPGFSFTATAEAGTWRLRTPRSGPDLLVRFDPIDTGPCDHRFQAKGHDPGVKLRHLTQVRYARCTGPGCRRPAAQCDYDHNTPYEQGGRSCLCNGGPKCRRDHRLKQDPRWTVDQLPDGTFRWTTPSGRIYTTEPTRYPI